MTITVPDCLYQNDTNFTHFRTPHIEIFRYRHQCSEVLNEVILNKNLLLFVNRGTKSVEVAGDQTSISDQHGAFIPKGSYLMTEISDATLRSGFESLMVLIDDVFLSDFYAQHAHRLAMADDGPRADPLAPWTRFGKTPFLEISMLSLGVFFEHPERVNAMYLEEKVREILLYLLETDCSRQLFAHMRFITTGGRNAKLLRFLERNHSQPWSIEDFAQQFGFSVSTFKRECNNALGMPPKRWINRRRLDSARQRLRCSNAPLTQIAVELGFADGSHFSRMFRKEFSCSPSDYRNLRPQAEISG